MTVYLLALLLLAAVFSHLGTLGKKNLFDLDSESALIGVTMKSMSKPSRDDGKWNFRMDSAASAEIRAYLKRAGLKQGPFFQRVGLAAIHAAVKDDARKAA